MKAGAVLDIELSLAVAEERGVVRLDRDSVDEKVIVDLLRRLPFDQHLLRSS